MDLKVGDIGLSGGNGFIQKAIRFFTSSRFSHSFTIVETLGIPSLLETTDTIVEVVSAETMGQNDGKDWFIVYRPLATDEEKLSAVKLNYSEYSGKWYGYLSYLWFMYRWVVRKFGYEPTTMWKWCSGGITCTELTVHFLFNLNSTFSSLFVNDLNTYSPQELFNIIKANPHLFELIYEQN